MPLRKNYFTKIVKYIKNVYNIEESLSRLTDKKGIQHSRPIKQ